MKSADYRVGRKAEIVSAQITYISCRRKGVAPLLIVKEMVVSTSSSLISVFSAQEKL